MFAGIEINLHVMIKVIGFRLIKKMQGLNAPAYLVL